jgi:photosystem II stability/assembly factor-like uncharacterized protein
MGDMDPRLAERLNQLYDHIESAQPPASLEDFDARASGRRRNLVHIGTAVAGVAVVAAAVGGLVVGLSSHRTAAPLPAPASRAPAPVVTTPAVAPSFSPPFTVAPSPSPMTAGTFQPVSVTAISESDYWVLGYTEMQGSGQWPAQLLHTTDGGASFQPAGPPSIEFSTRYSDANVRFADPSDGYAFGDELFGLSVTHDGGRTWNRLFTGTTVSELEPGSGGDVYAVVQQPCQGGNNCGSIVERSTATGDAWSALAVPAQSGHVAIGVHGSSLWVMEFESGKLYVSHDSGDHFSVATFPCDQGLAGNLDPVSDSVVWAFCATGNFGGPRVSSDGGRTWGAQSYCCVNSGIVAGVSASTAFVADSGVALRATHDGGATFSTVINGQPTGPFWVGFTDTSVGYAFVGAASSANVQQLYRTTDGGAHWAQVRFGR